MFPGQEELLILSRQRAWDLSIFRFLITANIVKLQIFNTCAGVYNSAYDTLSKQTGCGNRIQRQCDPFLSFLTASFLFCLKFQPAWKIGFHIHHFIAFSFSFSVLRHSNLILCFIGINSGSVIIISFEYHFHIHNYMQMLVSNVNFIEI